MAAQMIIIEGLIGVGKSTLAEQMAERTNYRFMREPVAENPYLEKFYADPKRYALEMQYWLMSARYAMHQEAIEYIWRTGNGVIMDRSIYGDAVFAEKNHLDGNIDAMGYDNYMKMRNVMTRSLMIPHVTLFLNAKPETCIERINMRDRSCESAIPIPYLAGLNELYQKLMGELKEKGSNVILLDWERFLSCSEVLDLLNMNNLQPGEFPLYKTITTEVQAV